MRRNKKGSEDRTGKVEDDKEDWEIGWQWVQVKENAWRRKWRWKSAEEKGWQRGVWIWEVVKAGNEDWKEKEKAEKGPTH